jgi:trehalose 6-phosphate phosphatase
MAAAPDPQALLEPLRADPGRSAILCDVDGTLAPIVDDPDESAISEPARETLAELAGRYRLVACVSGRRASVARRIVGVDALTYAGNHGLEVLRPGDPEPRPVAELAGHEDAAAEFVSRLDSDELAGAGLRLEDKGPIQAIHWRAAADQALAAERASEIAELAKREGLYPHFGRLVLEIRPLAEVDKGVAVRALVVGADASRAFYGGDDRTDLDAFAALRELERERALEHVVCVGVASEEGPPEIQREADLVVDSTGGFIDLLRSL